jgi:uncharacterized Zn-finger protein
MSSNPSSPKTRNMVVAAGSGWSTTSTMAQAVEVYFKPNPQGAKRLFRGTSGSPQLSPVPSPADPSPPLPSGAQLFLHHLDICCFDPSQTSEQQNPQVMASFGNANTMAARSPPDHLNTEYEAATPEPNPFSCNICKKTYSRVDHLARHYRSHTHERPFLCETCGKAFARA